MHSIPCLAPASVYRPLTHGQRQRFSSPRNPSESAQEHYTAHDNRSSGSSTRQDMTFLDPQLGGRSYTGAPTSSHLGAWTEGYQTQHGVRWESETRGFPPSYDSNQGSGGDLKSLESKDGQSAKSAGKRRGGGEEPQATTTGAKAPYKKAEVACNFCRGEPYSNKMRHEVAKQESQTVGRKLRCDGNRPACWNCRSRDRECEYSPYPRRRGPGKAPKGTKAKKRSKKSAASEESAQDTSEAPGQSGSSELIFHSETSTVPYPSHSPQAPPAHTTGTSTRMRFPHSEERSGATTAIPSQTRKGGGRQIIKIEEEEEEEGR
jgi:hypothetical protein